jgi:hypothetical protein
MRRNELCRLFVPLALLCALVGCSSRQPQEPAPPHFTATHITDLAAPEGYPAVERDTADALQRVSASLPAAPTRPLNILAVSGGGQYGSYGAGLLVGWSCSGTRPEFDIVTGISSGALIAMFAFLGPKYDPELTRYFTSTKREELFKFRPVLVHIIRDKAIASTEPLERLIDATIDADFMADLRAAHAAGRRLFIGTMELHSKRPVFWDVGAIASGCEPDATRTVKQLVLASSSIAGMTAAVPIDVTVNGYHYRELHVDGGGVAQTFVRFAPHHPRPDPANPTAKWLADSNLYCIAGGKLYMDPKPGELGFLDRALGNVSATLYALFRADAWRLYSLCAVSGMKFHMASIPLETPVHPRSMAFEEATMRRLYAMGYDFGRSGAPWRHTPPGYEPGEEDLPRAGRTFIVP